MTFSAHARVREDLGDSILCRRTLLALVRLGEGVDVVQGVVVRDVLQGVSDRLDKVGLRDGRHGSEGQVPQVNVRRW